MQSRYCTPNRGRFLNADALVSTGQGLLGNNMFAYCLNNPICRIDITGMAAADFYMNDGEIFDEKDLYDRGGAGTSWDIFMQCLDNAASGLNMALGRRSYPSSERHHILSNKSKKYTPQYKEFTNRYNFSLDSQENIIVMQDHKGRHTNAYHEFILTGLNALDAYANGNSARFYEGFKAIADFIRNNPWLPYARK